MTLIELVVTLVIFGFLLWMVNTYIPMAAPIKNLVNFIVVIIIALWLLRAFGLFSAGPVIVPLR